MSQVQNSLLITETIWEMVESDQNGLRDLLQREERFDIKELGPVILEI